jgi:hypothetical protein
MKSWKNDKGFIIKTLNDLKKEHHDYWFDMHKLERNTYQRNWTRKKREEKGCKKRKSRYI